MARTITVTVNMPTTAEGIAALDRAMEVFNSRVLAGALNKHPEIPYEEKVRFVQGLGGIVPWGKREEGKT